MPTKENVTVYDAMGSSRLRLSAWKNMVGGLWSYRELIRRLIYRNVAGQVRQSFLGYVWIALPPVATTVIFTMLKQAKIVNVPMENIDMPYPLFALIGTTVWGFFSQLTMSATGSIGAAGPLVTKIYFPRDVLIFSAAGMPVIQLLIRTVIVCITMAFFSFLPHAKVLLAPLLLMPIALFALGLGFFFAPLDTIVRDTGRILSFGFQFGMFLAPTIYPTPVLSRVTTDWEIALYWLHNINPVSHFIMAIDKLVAEGGFYWDTGLTVATTVSVLVFFMGWRFFHICEPLMAERL